MALLEAATRVVLMGIGATVIMDLWLMLMRALGVPTLNFALVGRWVGHLCHGRFSHTRIGQARPVHREAALGWIVHYATGIAFAVLLACIQGLAWLQAPTPAPAIIVGAATVVAPLFLIQPAMGAEFASSRTPAPGRNCLRSVMTHTAFGLGLYLSAVLIAFVS
ncbi:DUF2938 domain-containing protein [Microvirgula curvata]